MMLEVAVKFEKAFDRLEDEDASYRHDMRPNKEDWTNARTEGDFDILQWWKMNSDRFEVLGHMDRDILAIPVSTVVSELAFSIGGRVVDSSRCSLTPEIVEALICS
ncbi:transposase [Cucumis melo var. makuwa]|uniref:Transposase n=1 Tax=Cucumis melo var. makuwa TaxID=1194695 RepID=A0A5A7VRE6_CUCMM|nr:transposase [Cucumis melo var. makuwa]